MTTRNIVIISIIILLIGCKPPTGPDPGEEPADEQPTISELLATLPQFELALPPGVSDDVQASASVVPHVPRAVGDISESDLFDSPRAKGHGWENVRENSYLLRQLQIFVDVLVEHAAEHEILADEVVTVGIIPNRVVNGEYPWDLFDLNMGSFIVSETSEGCEVYWSANITDTPYMRENHPGLEYLTLLHFILKTAESGTRFELVCNIRYSFEGTPAEYYDIYSVVDEVTGEQTTAANILPGDWFLRTSVGLGEEARALMIDTSYGVRTVAYGDAQGGAVAGNNDRVVVWDGAYEEFYGPDGGTILTVYGDRFIQDNLVADYSADFEISGPFGLSEPPAQLIVIDGTTEDQISFDDGATFQPLTGWTSDQFFYFQAGAEMAEGDAVYGRTFEDTIGGDTVTSWRAAIFRSSTILAETVMTERQYAGASLRLNPSYETGYTFRMEEIRVNTQSSSYADGRSYSFNIPVNRYYLDRDGEGTTAWEYGDLLGLGATWRLDWKLDLATGLSEYVIASSYLGELPPWLEFSEESRVSYLRSKIVDVYNNEFQAMDISDYAEKLVDMQDMDQLPAW